MSRLLRLPKVMDVEWPLPRRLSPFYPAVAEESASWLAAFHVFTPDKQETFDRGNYEDYRTACDYFNLVFAIDDLTDDLSVDATARVGYIVTDALKFPEKERPQNEHVIGEMTKQFWSRAILFSKTIAQDRFIRHMEEFLGSLVEQARDREEGRTPSLEEYRSLRPLTGAMYPSFEVADLIVGLPEDVIEHPLMRSLRSVISDLVLLNNDLLSYNKEQATGDCHNFIPVVMHDKSLDLDGAVVWLAEEHQRQVDLALDLWPQALALRLGTPEVAKDLAFYVDHLMGWPLGCECYSFESGRYFGDEGLQVQKNRVVELLPRKGDANTLSLTTDIVQQYSRL
ncbi:terpenoid synthase [Earliella scabrosa]|nr:terpenoid synthase [Earliella scabrosa]